MGSAGMCRVQSYRYLWKRRHNPHTGFADRPPSSKPTHPTRNVCAIIQFPPTWRRLMIQGSQVIAKGRHACSRRCVRTLRVPSISRKWILPFTLRGPSSLPSSTPNTIPRRLTLTEIRSCCVRGLLCWVVVKLGPSRNTPVPMWAGFCVFSISLWQVDIPNLRTPHTYFSLAADTGAMGLASAWGLVCGHD